MTEDSTVTCASTANMDAGSLVSIELLGSRGHGDQLRPGGSAVIRGVAADGVATAEFVDKAGGVVASSPVTDNTYRLTVSDFSRGWAINLVSASGAARTLELNGS